MIMNEMTINIDVEQNEFSIDLKHFQRFFISSVTDRSTDGRTDGGTEPLIEVLWRT